MLRKPGVRRSVAIALLTVLVLAFGCGSSKEVKLDADDNGSQVQLERGQILVITLESNPSTGYRWEVVESEESIVQQKGEAVFKSSDTRDSPPPGTGGTETFRFEARSAGDVALKLVYHRSWEEGVEPLETFTLQVEVH
jgi:inhibitor of cysteine peptidase